MNTISDIVESLVYAQQAAERSGQGQAGQTEEGQPIQDISLNGAQVTSLINIINAVAAGVTKEGAISVITSAFPTISREQAINIVGGIQEGNIIPTTKEERIAIQKDEGEDTSGGSTPQEPAPTPPAPAGTRSKKK
jgi:hypothetical protein